MTAPLSKAPRILPAFEQLIKRKLLAPYATVRFSGGEPTLSPEFEPLLALLSNYGARSIVYTNATKRSEAIVEALRRDKVELVLGIDAATVEVYKAIKKMNYNEKVWKVVAEYCAAARPDAFNRVWAKFIFCLENYREAEHFVRRAEAAGVRYVHYDFDSSRVRPGKERGDVALPEEVADFVAVLRHECTKRGMTVEFAESGLAWLTPERAKRIERELERLGRTDGRVSTTALLKPASEADARRVRLLAAQAGLAWHTPQWSAENSAEPERSNFESTEVVRAALNESIAAQGLQSTTDKGASIRPGQLTPAQTQFVLVELVRLLAPARVLEIGTFFADTARVIATAMAEIGAGHLTTIDPFGRDRVPDIIAGWPRRLRDRVTFRPDNSMSYFLHLDEELRVKRGHDAPFDFIFVDGHHSFDYAFFDLMRSTLFLRPGGALVVDNVAQSGPAAAIRLFLDRHTHWRLFKADNAGAAAHNLSFNSTADSAIILAPDGIEIGPLPYRIDLHDLPITTIREVQIRVRRGASGILGVLVNFYGRPTDFASIGQGEQSQLRVVEQNIDANSDHTVVVKFEPPLDLIPRPNDRIAAQVELSFKPDGRDNLLVDAEPIKVS